MLNLFNIRRLPKAKARPHRRAAAAAAEQANAASPVISDPLAPVGEQLSPLGENASDGNGDSVVHGLIQALERHGYNGNEDGAGDADEDINLDEHNNNDGVDDAHGLILPIDPYPLARAVRLLSIIGGIRRDGTRTLRLIGDAWDSFANQPDFQEEFDRLVQGFRRNKSLETVDMNHGFFLGMGATHQETLLLSIAQLPSLRILGVGAKSNGLGDSTSEPPPVSINFPTLYQVLQRITPSQLWHIDLGGPLLQNDSHIEQLTKGVVNHGRSLQSFTIKDILVETKNIQGYMFDPILQAMVEPSVVDYREYGLQEFALTCRNNNEPDRPSLVSPHVLDRFLHHFPSKSIDVRGLGLTDKHCRSLRGQLGSGEGSEVTWLDLRRNPGIGQEGYEALVGIVCRNPGNPQILVDDPVWTAKLEMIRDMNRYCNRQSYLELGTFALKDQWVNFLCKVVETNAVSGAQKTDYLYYTIREDPHHFLAA